MPSHPDHAVYPAYRCRHPETQLLIYCTSASLQLTIHFIQIPESMLVAIAGLFCSVATTPLELFELGLDSLQSAAKSCKGRAASQPCGDEQGAADNMTRVG